MLLRLYYTTSKKLVKEKMKKMRKKINYINNNDLLGHLIKHKSDLNDSIVNDKPKPKVSNYIGQAILKINENLATKSNFGGYSWKDEMISDGVMDCIAAVDNFDATKMAVPNPLAYFTQIAWQAFVRRIQKEKLQNYIKHKNFHNNFEGSNEHVDGRVSTNSFHSSVVADYEEMLTKKKELAILKINEKKLKEKELKIESE